MWIPRLICAVLCFAATVPSIADERIDSAATAPNTERVSKGHWLTGLSALWDAQQSENAASLQGSDIDGSRSDWAMQLTATNVLYGRVAVGAAVRYGRNSISETYLNSDGNTVALEQLKTTLGVYGIFRPYTPLFNTQTAYAFAEISIGASATPIVREETTQGVLTRIYTDQWAFSIGMSPGLAIVLESGLAFEVGITLIGYQSTWSETSRNDVFESSVSTQSFDLQVNVLSLRLGLGYYF